jgi:hypothetical protein
MCVSVFVCVCVCVLSNGSTFPIELLMKLLTLRDGASFIHKCVLYVSL